MKPTESEEKLNEYWKIVYPKRIIERTLCQIVGRFTRRDLVGEKATNLVKNVRLSAVGGGKAQSVTSPTCLV